MGAPFFQWIRSFRVSVYRRLGYALHVSFKGFDYQGGHILGLLDDYMSLSEVSTARYERYFCSFLGGSHLRHTLMHKLSELVSTCLEADDSTVD